MSKILNFNRIGSIDKSKIADVHRDIISNIIGQDNIYHLKFII